MSLLTLLPSLVPDFVVLNCQEMCICVQTVKTWAKQNHICEASFCFLLKLAKKWSGPQTEL